jgi:hypothetical protein
VVTEPVRTNIFLQLLLSLSFTSSKSRCCVV